MPLIMRCLFYPPALCLSHCNACFPLAHIISALEPGDNNEFTEIEKCRGLNCMYLVTQTEAMAWERLVSQWHHLATQPLELNGAAVVYSSVTLTFLFALLYIFSSVFTVQKPSYVVLYVILNLVLTFKSQCVDHKMLMIMTCQCLVVPPRVC